MLSVVTLTVLIPAHAALDTMEMEHHAPVNHIIIIIFITIIIIIIIIVIILSKIFITKPQLKSCLQSTCCYKKSN